jgi:hypothetical protein
MATVKTNIWNLQVGDVITFTNYANSLIEIVVGRIELKSWYSNKGGRRSYGTLSDFEKSFPDFKITKLK